MRPPEFTGGNVDAIINAADVAAASMRPPEFTGGNRSRSAASRPAASGFNEAAGIHRR